MRRVLVPLISAVALTLVVTGSALGAHCINESKQDGAGEVSVVLLDPTTFQPLPFGTNPGGRIPGGFADVYLDVDASGTLTAPDVQIEENIFLVANHSHKANPAQGQPAVLPPIIDGRDPGGDGKGIGVADSDAP